MSVRNALLVVLGAASFGGVAQGADSPPQPAAPMAKFAGLHGVWRGPATGTNRDGSSFSVTQTERIGPLLGGDILVIEGRGYKDDGSTAFNAFGVISYDARAQKYEFRSYAQGYSGTFAMTPTADGYVWELPAGPGVIRYTAVVKGGKFHEAGEAVFPGKPPAQIFEMNLTRIGDTDWPLDKPVPSK